MRTVGVSGLLVGSQEMTVAGFLGLHLMVGLNSTLGIGRAMVCLCGLHTIFEACRGSQGSQEQSAACSLG